MRKHPARPEKANGTVGAGENDEAKVEAGSDDEIMILQI
jgi:hypothetical protein